MKQQKMQEKLCVRACERASDRACVSVYVCVFKSVPLYKKEKLQQKLFTCFFIFF